MFKTIGASAPIVNIFIFLLIKNKKISNTYYFNDRKITYQFYLIHIRYIDMLNSMKKFVTENQDFVLVVGILTVTTIQMHQATKIKNPIKRTVAACGIVFAGCQMLSVLADANELKLERILREEENRKIVESLDSAA